MRKLFIAVVFATVLPTSLAGAATDAGAPAWNYQAYKTAVEASGRTQNIPEKTFKQLQENRLKALTIIEKYLTSRFGKADPLVMKAFSELPREYYHHNYETKKSFAVAAYELENVKPWAIGYGSALSDYLGQAYMTQIAKPKPTDVVLEIGTGSGYQVSILSRIVKEAYSIEIIKPLGEGVAKIFKPLGYTNIQTRVGDGFYGWPEVKGGFDIIIVTCVAQYVPPALLEQLKPGGRLVIPIGQPFKKGGQFLYVYTKDAQGKVHSRKYTSVYFIPMTGVMEKKPAAGP